jgi:hypothetical protein
MGVSIGGPTVKTNADGYVWERQFSNWPLVDDGLHGVRGVQSAQGRKLRNAGTFGRCVRSGVDTSLLSIEKEGYKQRPVDISCLRKNVFGAGNRLKTKKI